MFGWIANGSGYKTVTASGVFTVLPYELQAAGLKALRIQRPGTNKWLWIEYRHSSGSFDSTLGVYSSNIYHGALIHYLNADGVSDATDIQLSLQRRWAKLPAATEIWMAVARATWLISSA